MLLATDLDGTFLGGKSLHKQQLYRLIRENTALKLVFVTGRGLESVIPLLNDPIIPNPDYIICDVGATIVNGHTLEPVEPLQAAIEKNWPGELKILDVLKDIPGLVYQEVPQQRRCSFFIEDETLIETVREAVASLRCDVIYSAGKFLDVLPGGVNKGTSLTKLIDHINVDYREVLVAGDTLNDLSMYTCGFNGVVVGNAEVRLVEATEMLDDVHFAAKAGAGGITEALDIFPAFSSLAKMPTEQMLVNAISETPQLVMMYHRFPYETTWSNGKKQYVSPKSPNGILPTLQSFFANGRAGVWIAWEETEQEGEVLRNFYIDKDRYPNLMAARIGLTSDEVELFYKTFAKEAFWPTIFSFVDKAQFNHHHWDHFVKINRRFAEKAAEQADHGAIVWIHDYNLWMVPGFLRQLRPDLTIAFFHHTAFPAANTFNILPWKREIIGSLLQCDFIGFHIPRYVENFVDVANSLFPVVAQEKINCAPRFLTYSAAIGVSQMTPGIFMDQRSVKLGALPVGIDMQHIRKLFADGSMQAKIDTLKQALRGKKMIVSAERLDYVKGPLEKILAFEQFLEEYPEFHSKVELVNICTPPAEGMKVYDEVKLQIEQAVGRINGKYSNINWTPIRLFFRAIPFEEILAYYGAADIAWITPLRDGLNLVAKEYIAVQGEVKGDKGVLVLSEFAGAAVELPYAVLTNPYDPKALRENLLQALIMNSEERNMRMERLYELVSHYDINYWAEDFLSQATGAQESPVPQAVEQTTLKGFAEEAVV
ncbi:glucosylglycerol-phosphate synthase [Terrimonas sp. NA20]|uniref:Glucosylglycerol-phosphate synthase n=1 Tax=Terrimonas ginsenosidimutans TaxID=2908004 RepID=A0ABS9KSS0_9BACT|nr:glucosylglycerol-phosphate synthase [Terrimonas ginsenosidimutans]MCG2615354.1 glucosylglycerol-phosphate synthase [Terrimonas ginsenosidimutans]